MGHGSTTDKYFSKTRRVIEKFGDRFVRYGVFMRRDVISALGRAEEFLIQAYQQDTGNDIPLEVAILHKEGSVVRDQQVLMVYGGSFLRLVELETELLQHVGFACVSAHNAFAMCRALPDAAFLDMHARHAAGPDMNLACAYGASVGSKAAQERGSVGFIGGSQDITAHFYGKEKGLGTMPHALIGYAGSTLKAALMYAEAVPEDQTITTLVDFYGQEYTDALAVMKMAQVDSRLKGKKMAFRLDTHGGRYAEGLDWEKSIEIVCEWLNVKTEFEAVHKVMGHRWFAGSSDGDKDRIRRVLFGMGVSAANIIQMRHTLNFVSGGDVADIVVSSGFDLAKCQIMYEAGAPIDVVGTGSFLPKTLAETYATADIFEYDGEFIVKEGREKLFEHLSMEK